MPDLKFDGDFYFSANNKVNGNYPLLIPVISNPNFLDSNSKIIPPLGIKEIINGDIGITEKIIMPLLKPSLDMILNSTYLKAEIMSSNNLKENELYNYLISLYIPKDIGLKPLEMSIISTLLESNKPLIDFLRLFLESIGVAEDIVCRFLGSHIKIAGKDIGFKSRNPLHWSSDLNYAKTINSSLKDMLTIVDSTINTIEESMSSKHPLKKNISLNSNNKQYGNTNNSYYIAYFDEFGNKIDPPKWIKDSKWFSKKILNEYGKEISINAPFEQLSDVFNDGADQLSQINKSVLNGINDSKKEMLKTIQERIDLINNKTEIQYLENEKQDAVQILDEIVIVMNDVLNGTNKEGNNYIDDDKSKGINSPLLLNEYISKNRASQFRIKYYPEQKSTIQNVVNSNGEAVEPYVNVPTFNVYYKGEYFNVEVPLAFSNQITTKVVESNSLFLDSKRTEIKDLNVIDYYVKNEITSISLNPNNEEKPFENDTVTYFGHDSKNEYLPDSIKRYFLPFEWNEVEEYDIINKRTNQVIRKEIEVVPYKIDVENDYELRLIKVINQPLIETGKNSNDSQIKFDDNTIIITKTNYMQFIKYDDIKQFSIEVLSSNTFTYARYVDESYFYNNRLFLFKKNLVWGNDYIDSDDCEFYRISGIEKNYNKIYKILINIPLVQVDSFTINNITKTITFNFTHDIPDYIINYNFGVNFKIKTPLNNVSIFVYKIESDKIYYKGELKDETVYNVFNVEYLEQTNIQTFQGFNLLKSYSTNLISISDINYTNNLKESDYLLIHGFDNSSFLSTITKRILNEGKDSYKFTQPNKEADNYYKILKIETVKTLKGIDILSLKLDYDIINIYDNKFYSYTDKLQFYYPLRFYPLSQLNNLIISNTETGTIFTDNNNIPKDSTPDINTENLLKEGIIYQGLDTRFIDRNKWKYFYLIEAVKKEDNGLAKINNSFNAKELALLKTTIELGTGKGKEWYGLLDKFTVTPMIVNQLIPIISKKMIPLFVKVINTISNPAKIKELLLELAVVNEDISKIPKNIKFLKKKEREKLKDVNNKGNEKDFTKRQKSLLYYNGVQERKNPLFTFDGKALAEFGLGAFGKSLFKFGIEIKNGEINIISSKDSDSQDQTIFTMILNMVKLPFEVLIKIFKWLLKWIKKLLIPSGIAKALKEFLSFEWLKEILSKESILGILGLSDIEAIFNKLKDIIMTNNTSDLQKKYNELLNFYSGGSSSEYVEVFIYDILKNGIKVGQDIEKKPYNSESVKDNSVNGGNIGDVIKNPFIGGSGDMNYSNLQLGQIFIKPLEMLHSIINLIQEFINGLIEIISSILGLDSLKLPKFGEQIPFANILKDIIEDIRKYEIKLQV